MSKGELQQLDEQVKSQHKSWESLSPEERRASVIQMRDAQTNNAQKSIVFLTIIGVVFLAITLQFWLNEYHMSLLSSSGIIGGMFLAAFGFQYIRSNRIESNSKLQTNDFSDDDVKAYFREHERVNQRALAQWNKNRYFVFIIGGVFLLSLNLRSTKEFSYMALLSGISIFLLGLFIFFVVQKIKSR
jgi:Ca2+/Na+ antiporter